LYKWPTAVHSEGKPIAGHVIIEKGESFHDEVKIDDKRTFSEGSNKNYFGQYKYCMIIQNI
jgi:hypothetical protein